MKISPQEQHDCISFFNSVRNGQCSKYIPVLQFYFLPHCQVKMFFMHHVAKQNYIVKANYVLQPCQRETTTMKAVDGPAITHNDTFTITVILLLFMYYFEFLYTSTST